MEESNESNEASRFRPPKSGEEESKLLNESVPKSTGYKNKCALKVFREWQMNREVKVPVMHSGGVFKNWPKLHGDYRYRKHGCRYVKLLAE